MGRGSGEVFLNLGRELLLECVRLVVENGGCVDFFERIFSIFGLFRLFRLFCLFRPLPRIFGDFLLSFLLFPLELCHFQDQFLLHLYCP